MTQQNVIESSVQQKDNYWYNTVFRLAATYDIIPDWWSRERDAFFRGYWYQENFLASAIYAIANRNAAFGWELKGIDSDVSYAQNMLQFADFGKGWQQFITKFTIDYVTMDNGAFVEVIRPAKVKIDGKTLPAIKELNETDIPMWYTWYNNKRIELKDTNVIFDSPLDLPIGIANLDAGQCRRTGNPDIPVIYTDRNSKQHFMKWWQVLDFNEMPSPIEKMNGVGYSALTRVFRASHIMQSISLYNDEKVSGRFNRAIFLTNADAGMINDAIEQTYHDADNRGLIRYSQPVVIDTVNPQVAPSVATINLAEIPDNFNFNDLQNWYIANLALALGVDYGFLAPLPGKGLGTASQSETMDKQSKGKSSRLFMDAVSNALNFRGVLPQTVQFNFVERDTEAEQTEEQTKKARADRFKVYIDSGIITPTIARQIASDYGDIDEKYIEAMGESDLTPIVTVDGDENLDTQDEMNEQAEIQLPDSEQVKAFRQHLFKEPTLVKRIKNVAKKVFQKKQITVPTVAQTSLQNALNEYANELETLVLSANNNEITKDEFEQQLATLVELALTTIYSNEVGLDVSEFSEQDIANLQEYIAVNIESVEKLSDDIYTGKYQDTEDRDGVLMLLGRLGLWTINAYALATLGQVFNSNNQEERYEFILGSTIEHCGDCLRLNNQVHTASEWSAHSDMLPRSHSLECKGFNCLCVLSKTDKQVSGDF